MGGSIHNNNKWKGSSIQGVVINGAVKDGMVFWKDRDIYIGQLSDLPINGLELKEALSSQENIRQGGSYIITTDSISDSFIVAIPSSRNLVKITSSNNETLFLNVRNDDENNFKLSTDITSIPNNLNIEEDYKVYILETVLLYSLGTTIIIDIV